MRRPWWNHYYRIAASPIPDMSVSLAISYLLVCRGFIETHAAEAEGYGWQPAHLLGPRGLGRSWALTEFMPPIVRFEPCVMAYMAPCGGYLIARRANPDGTVGLVTGEELTAVMGRSLVLMDAAGIARATDASCEESFSPTA